ncbi:MAG: T9SS type A sorting domain-containing protein [Flavobacteriales bacterium]
MKLLSYFFALLCVFTGLNASSQCTIAMTASVWGPCNGTVGNSGVLLGSLDCPGATSVVVDWENSIGITGSVTFNTSTGFQWPFPFQNGAAEICFTATAYDAQNEVLGTGEYCQFLPSANAITVEFDVLQNPTGCGLNNGCVAFEISGGTPPYQYFVGGINMPNPGTNNISNPVCGLAAGQGYIIITDASGCTVTFPFTLEALPSAGLYGSVYNDLNGNNEQGTGTFEEPNLGGQEFLVVEAGITVYTNENGYFSLPELADGTYTLQFTGDQDAWSGADVVVEVPGCVGIPLTSDLPVYGQNSGTTGWSSIIHCQNGTNTGVWVANTGNTAFSGTVTLSTLGNMTFSYLNTGPGANISEPGMLTWNITDQEPGTLVNYAAHINGPGTSWLGQNIPITLTLTLVDADGNVFYTNTWNLSPVVTCAYDPNDKIALPEGYAEPHFILADTDITYTIRFQNTGNAPAEDVWIEDLLHTEFLNIETFEPLAASHDYYTELQPDGRLRFFFDNIMLPDSTNDEPNSHGYVTFRISLRDDVEPGDVILNDAAIYFDLNEPIITNETWHTVYSCDALNTDNSEINACFGSFIILENTTEYVESYAWTWNDELISETSEYVHYAMPVGSNTLSLTLSNPLCTVTTTREAIVHDEPAVAIVMEGSNLVATAGGASYEWFLDGMPITGASGNAIDIGLGPDGIYTVTIFDEFGCYGSAQITIVGVAENNSAAPVLFPNPVTNATRLQLPAGIWTMRIYDATGRLISENHRTQGIASLSAQPLNAGYYLLRSTNESGDEWTIPFILK